MKEAYKKVPNLSTIENELTNESLEKDLRKSISLFNNKGFSLSNPTINKKPPPDNYVVRTVTTTFTAAARRRMIKFLLHNAFKPEYYQFSTTLTIPLYPLNEKTIQKLQKTFNTYSQRLPFEFGAVGRAEVQDRGSIHFHLIAGVTTNDHKVISETIEKLWIDTLKTIGTIPIEYKGTYKEPIKLNPDEVTEEYNYFDELEKHYNLANNPKRRDFIYKKMCDVVFFETQEHTNVLRYISEHATKSKRKQIHKFNIHHWFRISKVAFSPDAGETTFLSDEMFFTICRWLSRLKTPFFHSQHKYSLFGRRKGRNFKKIGKVGTHNIFGNPKTMQRMLDLVLDKPPDKQSYLPT
jgi:hypothetical protein